MAILTCPDCGVKVQPEDLICFRCGANLPHTPYADDDIPSPTVSQQYLRPGDGRDMCPNCGTMVQDPADVVCTNCRQPLPGGRRRISPVVLRISFPTGNVDVPAGNGGLMVSRAGFYPALPVKQRTGRCAVTQLRNVAGGALHTIAVRPE